MTCHKLHDVFEGLQPPVTVLDCDVTRPKFQTKVGSVVPLIDIFQFEWDEWADMLMKKFVVEEKTCQCERWKGAGKALPSLDTHRRGKNLAERAFGACKDN